MLIWFFLHESGDVAVIIDAYVFRGRMSGQTRHSHDVSGNGNQEASSGSYLYFPYGDDEVFGPAQQGGVVGK